MRVGILGSGLMGGKVGTLLARAGHEVVFSYARNEHKLERLARDATGKVRAGTPREAAQEADAILLAVHWSRIEDVLHQTGDLSGKVVITCSLPMNDDNTELVVAHTSSKGPLSRWFRQRIAKRASLLVSPLDPAREAGVLPIEAPPGALLSIFASYRSDQSCTAPGPVFICSASEELTRRAAEDESHVHSWFS
jgi:hypothetical protein